MPFATTQELLDRARDFHQRLSSFYGKLEAATDKQKVQKLADYLRRHEDLLAKALEQFKADLDPSTLKTWFKNTPDDSHWKALKSLDFSKIANVESLTRLALDADATLIKVYKELAGLAQAKKVRELFESLAKVAEGDRDHFAEGVQE